MGTAALITALLPLIQNLTPVLIAALQHVRKQKDKTTLQIIEDAGIILQDNERKLLEDLIRLRAI